MGEFPDPGLDRDGERCPAGSAHCGVHRVVGAYGEHLLTLPGSGEARPLDDWQLWMLSRYNIDAAFIEEILSSAGKVGESEG